MRLPYCLKLHCGLTPAQRLWDGSTGLWPCAAAAAASSSRCLRCASLASLDSSRPPQPSRATPPSCTRRAASCTRILHSLNSATSGLENSFLRNDSGNQVTCACRLMAQVRPAAGRRCGGLPRDSLRRATGEWEPMDAAQPAPPVGAQAVG